MIKNQVPVTPANYALWYAYVNEALPELNTEMDQILKHYDVCPPAINERLYERHVAKKNDIALNEVRTNMEALVTEVAQSMNDAMEDTTAFSNAISHYFSYLDQIDEKSLNLNETTEIVRQLISESKDIQNSTLYLKSQLHNASSEIESLQAQLSAVEKESLIDSLSKIYNRRAFDKDMLALCSNNQAMCLILVDIDHFKGFNDQYGHLFGDTIIKRLAKRLQENCRDAITLYRFGGEEFAIIIPQHNLRIARQFAEANRRTIEKMNIKDRRTGEQINRITASFGVAERRDNDSPEQLIERADKALYSAKNLGRNRVMPL